LLGARGWGLPGKRSAPRTSQITWRADYAIPPRGSSIELATGVHLPVKGWADARIGQSLKINFVD